MDFGLRGRTAIVCAASMGLGRSCAVALGGEGVKLVIVARRREILEHAADEIRAATGAETVAVVADVTTQDGRDAILSACPNPDILINNAGGPPPGDFRNWDRGDWIKALDANMLAPIELMKSTMRRHDCTQVRADREYHFARGQGTDRHARTIQWRALGPHRFCGGPCPCHCRAQCHHQ
jgi:NADP-dependent 3-hydroxy acid dehydrogenase YdfG